MFLVLLLIFFSSTCFAQTTDTLLAQTSLYHQQGQANIAIKKLQTALQQAKPLSVDYFELSHELILFYIATRQFELAQTTALQNLNLAQQFENPLLIAKSLNQLGKIAIAHQQEAKAKKYYLDALNLEFNNKQLKNTILVNLAQLDANYIDKAIQHTIIDLPNSESKLNALLILAKKQNHILLYQQALQLSQAVNKPRLKSIAYGYLAEYYQRYQSNNEALQLLQSALFFAQHDIDLLYRWQWRKAQILKTQQKISDSIQYYQLSLDNIEKIRSALLLGYIGEKNHFERFVKPVYFELIDILLQQEDDKQQRLQQAIAILENYKSLELENYFQDDCVSKTSQLQQPIPTSTAIFYPILLPERTELLLLIQGQITQITIQQQYSQDLEWLIQRFLLRLDQRIGQKIYSWLIEPITETLEKNQIDTLVIVPYDILYTLPFAALHNGQDYLIKSYALAVTPSLQLTTLKSTTQFVYKPLAGGLSKSMGQFPALPYVHQELQQIDMIWDEKQLLKNNRFQFDTLYQTLKQQPYNLLHLATHAQITPQVRDSFLLTYEGKMNLNQLEKLVRLRQFQQQPIELLTLSACQTAQTGDRQAALGIAGLAVKSGAHSVLASLWAIDDAATAELISIFYQQLARKTVSKSQALQQAQQKLMQLTTYRHPRYWSGFILIGNWL
ncbi:CHAT domain-containing protein [Candidatus Albibeggiatoa sp. nov. NOAA]|uniref:CHAT domain-containing protein n=1 Tax=Candidatus Albibeggiatoa sp. nov. NOAA TaxID=3162724 RepID=UPI0032F6C4FB|nr:CHAT domain-containing protein [Thiotrichaceae bacterium]